MSQSVVKESEASQRPLKGIEGMGRYRKVPSRDTLQELTDWNAMVGRLLLCDDRESLLSELVELLSYRIHLDSWLVAIFHTRSQPTIIGYKEYGEMEDSYAAGPYLLDPFYDIFLNKGCSGCYLLKDIAPDNFMRTEFFRTYYSNIGLGDEIGYLFRLGSDMAMHISIARAHGSPKFRKGELAWFKSAESVVGAAAIKLWHLCDDSMELSAGRRTDFHAYLTNTFQCFGESILTPREKEVTQLLLKGFSAKSIARIFEISHETVRNHMRRIYSKFRINSQVELFTLFFETLDGIPQIDA